jgi:hypothetical protein
MLGSNPVCRLPTAATRVRDRVKSRWICGGQSRTSAGFLRVLRFPLANLSFHQLPNNHNLTTRAGTILYSSQKEAIPVGGRGVIEVGFF